MVKLTVGSKITTEIQSNNYRQLSPKHRELRKHHRESELLPIRDRVDLPENHEKSDENPGLRNAFTSAQNRRNHVLFGNLDVIVSRDRRFLFQQ